MAYSVILKFKSINEYNWAIELTSSRYTSADAAKTIKLGTTPIEWQEPDGLNNTVMGATGKMNVILDGDNLDNESYNRIFVARNATDIKVRVYRDYVNSSNKGTVFFQGFVKSEISRQSWNPYPYKQTVNIWDALAAGDDISPDSKMTGATCGRFTFLDLLNWWKDDTGVDISHVYSTSDLNTDYIPITKFLELRKNVNGISDYIVDTKSYKSIMKTLLGATRIAFRGKRVYVGNRHSSEAMRDYTPQGGVLVCTSTEAAATRPNLDTDYTIEDDDHSKQVFPPVYKHYTIAVDNDVDNVKIDHEANTNIYASEMEDGLTIMGQGNLLINSHGSTGTEAISSYGAKGNYYTKDDDGKVHIEKNEGLISLTASVKDTTKDRVVLKLRSYVPVAFDAVKYFLIKGCIIKRTYNETTHTYDEVTYAPTGTSRFSYSLKWGDRYYKHPTHQEGAGYTSDYSQTWENTEEVKQDLYMVENAGNDFRDIEYDNGNNGMLCVYEGFENFEGIHVVGDRQRKAKDTPSISGSGILEFTVYLKKDRISTEAIFKDISIEAVTKPSVPKYRGNSRNPQSESVQCPYGGGNKPTALTFWTAGDRASTETLKIKGLRTVQMDEYQTTFGKKTIDDFIFPISIGSSDCLLNNNSYLPLSVGFSPREDNGWMVLYKENS